MADTNTTITDLLLMETASHDNDWGEQNNTTISAIEAMTKATRANATTGGTTTLTKTTAREWHQRVTGILTSNAIIEVPNVQSNWVFSNETSGDYTVTVKVSGQTGVAIPRGASMWLRGNGTDVVASNLSMPRGMDIMAASVGGTADVITATLSPAITGYAGRVFVAWTSPGANTVTTPTINFNGLGALTIKKGASAALAVGDTGASGNICFGVLNGTDVLLLNPAGVGAASTSAQGVVELATNAEALAVTDTGRAITPSNLAAFLGKGSDIASAGTITIGDGGYFDVTGTTTITDIDLTVDFTGRPFELQFDGILTLTHSSTLILPGNANIITAAGDIARFRSEGSDAVRCMQYTRADGRPLVVGGLSLITTIDTSTGASFYEVSTGILSSYRFIRLELNEVSLSAASSMTLQPSSTGGAPWPTETVITGALAAAGNIFQGPIDIHNIQATAQNAIIVDCTAGVYTNNTTDDGNFLSANLITALKASSGAMNAFRLRVSSGNYDAGTITVWGGS